MTLSDGTTTITLPDNLLWEDELAWDARIQSTSQTLTGALVVQESTRLGGRPITYRGGLPWVQITRTDLLALLSLGASGLPLTLKHHDNRTFRVLPRREQGQAWVKSTPWPVVGDSGSANPTSASLYTLDELRLIEVPA